MLDDVTHGASIAVDGVCLTDVEFTADTFTVDVMQESLNHSSLGVLEVGSHVNLERALAANARLGGHVVQGHVDGVAELLHRTSSEHWDVLRFAVLDNLARYVVEKDSIAFNGTSLTVSAVRQDDESGQHWFEVSLIPTTLEITNLGELAEGQAVNVEVDALAKYVERLIALQG